MKPRVTQHDPVRWIVRHSASGSTRLSGVQSVLSTGWQVVSTSIPMISKSPTVYQTSYDLLREAMRDVLRPVVESGPGAGGGMGSVPWRACAALYSLLETHPVDRRGRCRSCRRPGAVLGRARRRCQVRVWACYWLHQPDETLLLGLLARELDQHSPPSAGAGERADRVSLGHAAPVSNPDCTDLLPDPPSVARRRPRRLTGTDIPIAAGQGHK